MLEKGHAGSTKAVGVLFVFFLFLKLGITGILYYFTFCNIACIYSHNILSKLLKIYECLYKTKSI